MVVDLREFCGSPLKRQAAFYKFSKSSHPPGMVLLLLDCSLDGNEGDHLSLHLVHLGHHLAHHLVHLRLVVDIQLGKSEKGDPCEDDEGEGVEPGTNVGEKPKGETELDCVHHGLDQEESPQLEDGSVDSGSKARGGR